MAKLTMVEEASAPGTPGANAWVIYPLATGLYIKDDAGVVTGPLVARGTQRVWKTVADPVGWYTDIRAQVVLFRADAAITITRIHINGNDSTPGGELAGDLKFADDVFTGSFANATVIDICDTTSGAVTITTGFDDATVPSGKYVYFQMDAAPHADWKDFYIEVYYTYD